MAEAPGYQTMNFAVLARKASETAVSSLNELCKTSPDLSDTEKKIALLKCVLKTRQRLLRLLALSKWCRQVNLLFIILFICCQETITGLEVSLPLHSVCSQEVMVYLIYYKSVCGMYLT